MPCKFPAFLCMWASLQTWAYMQMHAGLLSLTYQKQRFPLSPAASVGRGGTWLSVSSSSACSRMLTWFTRWENSARVKAMDALYCLDPTDKTEHVLKNDWIWKWTCTYTGPHYRLTLTSPLQTVHHHQTCDHHLEDQGVGQHGIGAVGMLLLFVFLAGGVWGTTVCLWRQVEQHQVEVLQHRLAEGRQLRLHQTREKPRRGGDMMEMRLLKEKHWIRFSIFFILLIIQSNMYTRSTFCKISALVI